MCNWHRPHGSLNSKPPISRLGQPMENLLRFHSWSLHKYATWVRGYETPDVSHTHSVGNTRTAPLSADDANKA